MIPQAPEADEPREYPAPSTGLAILMFASFLALIALWTGVTATIWFSLQSEQTGITAALMSACWIGFGAGALIGSLVGHWAFESDAIHPLLQVFVPMVGASIGLAVFGLIAAGVLQGFGALP